MIVSRSMYIRNIAYILLNWEDIYIVDMNELYAIADLGCHQSKGKNPTSSKKSYNMYNLSLP